MLKRKIFFTILILLFSSFSFFVLSSYKEKAVFAQASCPSNMDPNSQECYEYLLDQLESLKKQETSMQKQLEKEEYNQLSLQEKITYTNNQIEQTEKVIQSLQVEIAANDVEIKLLEKSIKEKEDNIAILKQEIDVLGESLDKRITESYKYSFAGTFELLLDVNNLSTFLRKVKYLASTRNQDREYLEDYTEKANSLKKEEEVLAENKATVQIKRNSIEEEKISLAESKKELDSQKTEREALLAESKAKQAKLLAEMRSNKALQTSLDAQIIAYVNAHMGDMVEKGPVAKGGLIGYVASGGNKCGSTGSHLHFGISKSTMKQYFYASIPIWNNGYLKMGSGSGRVGSDGWEWPYAYSGIYTMPITGSSIIVSQDYHEGDASNYHATDLIRADGTTGGAAVVAATSGTVYRYTYCEQGYVIVDHDSDDYRTIYLHLAL